MKTIFSIAAIAMLLSCSNSTQIEQKKTLESVYGAEVSRDIITDDTGSQLLKVTLSNSKVLDTLHPNITSANSALLIYQSLSDEERQTISNIGVEIITSSNQNASFTYPIEIMTGIHEKSQVFDEISKNLIRKNFSAVDKQRNTSDVPGGIATTLKERIKYFEKKHGKLKGFRTFGLAEETDNIGSAYQFQAFLDFEKGSVPYFFYLDTQKGKDLWVGFMM
jgi:hypothetical protein